MTQQELLSLHTAMAEAAKKLMQLKNSDYAHETDPFRNFRMFGGLGILVRLSDKLARLRSYEEKGSFVVADEGLYDTVLDLVNYAILYYGYKTDENAAKQPRPQIETRTMTLSKPTGFGQ